MAGIFITALTNGGPIVQFENWTIQGLFQNYIQHSANGVAAVHRGSRIRQDFNTFHGRKGERRQVECIDGYAVGAGNHPASVDEYQARIRTPALDLGELQATLDRRFGASLLRDMLQHVRDAGESQLIHFLSGEYGNGQRRIRTAVCPYVSWTDCQVCPGNYDLIE
jgi:hypothetical protein